MTDVAPAVSQRLLVGSPFVSVARQGSFLALAMGSHAAINLVDLWLVGKLGSPAVAGVHVATTINFLPMIVGNGVTVASIAAMARALGAGDHAEARRISERAFTFMLALGLGLGLVLALLTGPSIDLQGAVGEARRVGVHYLLVANLGTVAMFALLQATASMRAAGETAMPLALLLGANLLNLLLDVVLLFGWPRMGVPALGAPGAAYAAVIARSLAAAIGVWWLRRPRHPLRVVTLRWSGPPRELRRMLMVGLPQSLQMVARTVVVIAVTAVAARLSPDAALTALSVTTRLDTVVLFSAAGFASAATTLVGFALGAGDRVRARAIAHIAAWSALVVAALAASGLVAGTPSLFAVLVPDASAAVRTLGASYLAIAVLGHAFGGYALGATGGINGAGRTLPPLLLDAAVYCALLPPALWFASWRCAPGSELQPLWWCLSGVHVVLAIVHWLYLRSGHWLT